MFKNIDDKWRISSEKWSMKKKYQMAIRQVKKYNTEPISKPEDWFSKNTQSEALREKKENAEKIFAV